MQDAGPGDLRPWNAARGLMPRPSYLDQIRALDPVKDHQRIVFLRGHSGIGQVGKQGKMNIGIVVSQISHFQALDRTFDLLFAQQQCWYSYQRGAIFRDIF